MVLLYCLKKLPLTNDENVPEFGIGELRYKTPNSTPSLLSAFPGSKLNVADSPAGIHGPTGFRVIVLVPPVIE
jgi:hypothetical protein